MSLVSAFAPLLLSVMPPQIVQQNDELESQGLDFASMTMHGEACSADGHKLFATFSTFANVPNKTDGMKELWFGVQSGIQKSIASSFEENLSQMKVSQIYQESVEIRDTGSGFDIFFMRDMPRFRVSFLMLANEIFPGIRINSNMTMNDFFISPTPLPECEAVPMNELI